MTKSVSVITMFLLTTLVATAQPRTAQMLTDKSWVSYRIVHPLHVMDATSHSVQYSLELDPSKKEITSVTAQVDVTTFDSGNSNRDSHAMEVVDAITYPDVMFTSTSIVQKGDSLWATGKLTFHGVMKSVTMSGTAQWLSNEVDIKGSFDLSLTEFKIERPALLMIPVHDDLAFTLTAAFTWK